MIEKHPFLVALFLKKNSTKEKKHRRGISDIVISAVKHHFLFFSKTSLTRRRGFFLSFILNKSIPHYSLYQCLFVDTSPSSFISLAEGDRPVYSRTRRVNSLYSRLISEWTNEVSPTVQRIQATAHHPSPSSIRFSLSFIALRLSSSYFMMNDRELTRPCYS